MFPEERLEPPTRRLVLLVKLADQLRRSVFVVIDDFPDPDVAHHQRAVVGELKLEQRRRLCDFERPILIYSQADKEVATRLGQPMHRAAG